MVVDHVLNNKGDRGVNRKLLLLYLPFTDEELEDREVKQLDQGHTAGSVKV